DGDFVLDSTAGVRTAESFVRYVFAIGDTRYFVRDGGMKAGAGWRLYRIPFRTDTLQVGAPSLRQVQSLRITVVAAAPAGGSEQALPFALSRVRLVGSSWVKRSDTPIAGIGGDRGTVVGEVIASVVSTENQDLGYTSPPGVTDQAGRRDAGFQIPPTSCATARTSRTCAIPAPRRRTCRACRRSRRGCGASGRAWSWTRRSCGSTTSGSATWYVRPARRAPSISPWRLPMSPTSRSVCRGATGSFAN